MRVNVINKTKNRIAFVCLVILLMFFLCVARLYYIVSTDRYTSVFSDQGKLTVEAGHTDCVIYDRNMQPLVNRYCVYKAVVVPTPQSVTEIRPYVTDKEEFNEKIKTQKPFACTVTKNVFDSEDIYVFEVPVRYSDDDLAVHIVGYTSDGKGVCGIEKTYDPVLRGNGKDLSISFESDAMGGVLKGKKSKITNDSVTEGVVITIDSSVQKICENVCSDVKKGAVVVMDAESGDILAMASFPNYKRSEISNALKRSDSPLINRALSAYSVGSIFKLVTCAAAYESGEDISFSYECTGKITVDGTDFHCHDLNGHGKQNISEALVNSCNPFFIELGKRLEPDLFLQTAKSFGFGREIVLTGDISSESGTLPSVSELGSSGEKANFSFGQGKLTASPLQVAQFTCAIANGGNMPAAKLVKGYTFNGENIENEKSSITAKVMSEEAAKWLQNLMKDVVYNNETTNLKPFCTTAAAKTSTAQTGIYKSDGTEYNNAWVTGMFPVQEPKYVVTVLVEEAVSGNEDAAPLFRKIADEIYKIKK